MPWATGNCLAAVLALMFLAAPSHGQSVVDGESGSGRELGPSPEPEWCLGILVPHRTATLGANRAGRIAQIAVTEGARVNNGERVFVLENDAQQVRAALAKAAAESDLEIQAARLEWNQALQELERLRRLDGDRNASSKELTDAELRAEILETVYDQAELRHEQAQRSYQLEEAILREYSGFAPFDGWVTSRLREIGEPVSELQPILTLVQVDPLTAVFDLPTNRAGAFVVDQPVELFGPDLSTSKMGVIYFKSPVVDGASQTVRVKVSIPNSDGAWLAGSKVQLNTVSDRDARENAGASSAAHGPPNSKDQAGATHVRRP